MPILDGWCRNCIEGPEYELCPFYPKNAKNGRVDVVLNSGNELHNLKMIRCEREGYEVAEGPIGTENNLVSFLYNRPVTNLGHGTDATMGYVPRTVTIPIRNIVAVMAAPSFADVAEAGEKERTLSRHDKRG